MINHFFLILHDPYVEPYLIPYMREMELSFVIWMIVLGSGYIEFPVAKVFLAVFNKFIE